MDSPVFAHTPTRTLLHDDSFQETPVTRKQNVKVVSPPCMDDEDSGLGMDFDLKPLEDEEDMNFDLREILTPELFTGFSLNTRHLKNTPCRNKRALSDGDTNDVTTKRRRNDSPRDERVRRKIKTMKKSLSFGDTPTTVDPLTSSNDIIDIVDKLVMEQDLIGNGSGSHSLPTIPGKHADLKSISTETMADLLTGRYDDVIKSYRVIDCRYPYEYEGGHIQGADNLYTRDLVKDILADRQMAALDSENKRDILIFHCEFSSERGPKMYRHLRKLDRETNKDKYPYLHFPEIYLLHDGYKAFYETQKALCEPQEYRTMRDSNFTEELRHFRSKSKSWCAGQKKRGISKLRF